MKLSVPNLKQVHKWLPYLSQHAETTVLRKANRLYHFSSLSWIGKSFLPLPFYAEMALSSANEYKKEVYKFGQIWSSTSWKLIKVQIYWHKSLILWFRTEVWFHDFGLKSKKCLLCSMVLEYKWDKNYLSKWMPNKLLSMKMNQVHFLKLLKLCIGQLISYTPCPVYNYSGRTLVKRQV